MFGNIGSSEIVVLIVVGILLFGSKKSSEIARDLGKAKKEYSKAKQEYENTLNDAAEELEDLEEATTDEKSEKPSTPSK